MTAAAISHSEAGCDRAEETHHGHDQHEQKLALGGLTIPTDLVSELAEGTVDLVSELTEGNVEVGTQVALQSLKLKGHVGTRRDVRPTNRRKMLHQRRRLLRTQRRFQTDIQIMTTLLGDSHNKNLESTKANPTGPDQDRGTTTQVADVNRHPTQPPRQSRRAPLADEMKSYRLYSGHEDRHLHPRCDFRGR